MYVRLLYGCVHKAYHSMIYSVFPGLEGSTAALQNERISAAERRFSAMLRSLASRRQATICADMLLYRFSPSLRGVSAGPHSASLVACWQRRPSSCLWTGRAFSRHTVSSPHVRASKRVSKGALKAGLLARHARQSRPLALPAAPCLA